MDLAEEVGQVVGLFPFAPPDEQCNRARDDENDHDK
jgi:hypothetical protein